MTSLEINHVEREIRATRCSLDGVRAPITLKLALETEEAHYTDRRIP